MSAKRRNTLLDLSRVIGPEPLSHLGNLMIRHPQYFRGLVLLLFTSAVSNENYKRATISVIILVSIRTIGMLLKFGPALLLNRLKKTAYLAGHRYNIAQKRSYVTALMPLFWKNVYEPESRTLFDAHEIKEQHEHDQNLTRELSRNLNSLPGWVACELNHTSSNEHQFLDAIQQTRPVSCGIEITEASFNTSFLHALRTDYDRISQTAVTGLNMNAIEDYLRSPILGEHDGFPSQNWTGNPHLNRLRRRIKNYTPPTGCPFKAEYAPKTAICYNLHRTMWHTLVTNVITKRTGTAIRKLNRLFDTEEISVQTLLWPECGDAAWINQYDGLREAIIMVRQRMLDQAFGEIPERAEIMIERLTRWDELQAMHLRARVDINYINPSESINLLEDYKELKDYPHRLPLVKEFTIRALAESNRFDTWLSTCPEGWSEQLRLTTQERMRSIALTIRRLQNYILTNTPEHKLLYEQYGAQLEQALQFYTSDENVLDSGLPETLMQLVHRYDESLKASAGNLFSIQNAEALRAVRTAFHSNINNLRTVFLETNSPEREPRLQPLIASAIKQRSQITAELIELRIHHTLCKVQRTIYMEFVKGLRDPSRLTRKERARQRLDTILLKCRPS